MSSLHRLTTEYVEAEDRIRITGELTNSADDGPTSPTVVLWLTQRLLNRLLPHLFSWLEQHDTPQGWSEEAVQSFAQQAAVAALQAQAAEPVCSAAQSPSWLVHSLQLTSTPEQLQLHFPAAAQQPTERISLTLAAQPLRQWLHIVYDLYVRAGWPLALWPLWLVEKRQLGGTHSSTWLH
jgi:hypothetical protein